MEESKLIFIISQPRSGSTYLQNLLSNNNQVNTCSEPWIMLNFTPFLKPKLIQSGYNQRWTYDAFEEFLLKYPELDFNERLKSFVLQLYQPMASGYDFVIDKTPRYWEIIEELMALFPKSHFIVLKRNPLDVGRSIINTWNTTSIEKLFRFQRDLLLAPKVLHEFLQKNNNNPQVFGLTYEELISDLSGTTQKLYKWLDIEYSEEVLETTNNIKYKGKFGDPRQNSVKPVKKSTDINRESYFTNQFLLGYEAYLTEDFLFEYGGYKSNGGQETKTFNTFFNMEDLIWKLNRQLNDIRSSTTFQVGDLILKPLKAVQRLFKMN
ncbi:sulfotransferase family protein [Mangrovimonas futianensis]|uniref:sulfotransferase family protein n=1 Tax=Mangrovimonas futianensis TaxID=2895523 RepID=UPI001E39F4F0|nr:sulfotransferase [Mangrovimonas futianensis]MCF1421387.1 sulfotransferase [Mangrovimonas futianensis]